MRMNRILEIRERVAKYGLSRIAKDEVAWWNARDELNFNAYDDLQYLLQDHTRLTAEIESLTAERDRFKARAEAAEKDLQESGSCYVCANKEKPLYWCQLCTRGNSKWEWRGPQEGAAE
jgi:hypothetical protein